MPVPAVFSGICFIHTCMLLLMHLDTTHRTRGIPPYETGDVVSQAAQPQGASCFFFMSLLDFRFELLRTH